MANREKGEFDLEIKGKTYTFVLDIDAMIAMEDLFSTPQTDVTFDELMRRLQRGSVKATRALIWAALRRHHKEISLADAGDLIRDAGGIDGLSGQIQKLHGSTVPDREDVAELGVKNEENPPEAQAGKRRRGTGETSPLRRVVSA